MFRGQLRTSRYAWDEIKAAALVRLRTVSPLSGLFPYVKLASQLQAGDKREG